MNGFNEKTFEQWNVKNHLESLVPGSSSEVRGDTLVVSGLMAFRHNIVKKLEELYDKIKKDLHFENV